MHEGFNINIKYYKKIIQIIIIFTLLIFKIKKTNVVYYILIIHENSKKI